MLNDTQIRALKPTGKLRKVSDSGGLQLHVLPTGTKVWRLKYRFDGKEKLLTFGRYPMVGLAEARGLRETAKRALHDGTDPGDVPEPEDVPVVRCFQEVAREWHGKQLVRWSERHAEDVLHSLERDIFPHFGNAPLPSIKPQQVLVALRAIEHRSPETARRVRQRVENVFAYAIGTDEAEDNPAAKLGIALTPPDKSRHWPATTTLDAAQAAFRTLMDYSASPEVRCAMAMCALTAQRPGHVRTIEWAHIDFDARVLRTPFGLMKGSKTRKALALTWDTSLSEPVIARLEALRPITGHKRFVFSSPYGQRPISDNTLGVLCKRAGLQDIQSAHGWRATFTTIMNERHSTVENYGKAIDLVLAHLPADPVKAAYERMQFIDLRREILDEWAEILTSGKG